MDEAPANGRTPLGFRYLQAWSYADTSSTSSGGGEDEAQAELNVARYFRVPETSSCAMKVEASFPNDPRKRYSEFVID